MQKLNKEEMKQISGGAKFYQCMYPMGKNIKGKDYVCGQMFWGNTAASDFFMHVLVKDHFYDGISFF